MLKVLLVLIAVPAFGFAREPASVSREVASVEECITLGRSFVAIPPHELNASQLAFSCVVSNDTRGS